MRRVTTLLFIAFFSACQLSVWAEKKPEMCRIYIFGFAASFTDSIAAQTSIQTLDDAWIDPSQAEEGCKNAICSVFFSKNPRKLQRTWKKIRKRYEQAEGLQMRLLTEERFSFKAEEYHEITIGEETPVQTESKASSKKKKRSK